MTDVSVTFHQRINVFTVKVGVASVDVGAEELENLLDAVALAMRIRKHTRELYGQKSELSREAEEGPQPVRSESPVFRPGTRRREDT